MVGSFAASDNSCLNCRHGYQSSCVHREFMLRAQAPFLRVPLADGTLVPTPGGVPADDLKQIEGTLSHITIEGARYPEHLQRLVGR